MLFISSQTGSGNGTGVSPSGHAPDYGSLVIEACSATPTRSHAGSDTSFILVPSPILHLQLRPRLFDASETIEIARLVMASHYHTARIPTPNAILRHLWREPLPIRLIASSIGVQTSARDTVTHWQLYPRLNGESVGRKHIWLFTDFILLLHISHHRVRVLNPIALRLVPVTFPLYRRCTKNERTDHVYLRALPITLV